MSWSQAAFRRLAERTDRLAAYFGERNVFKQNDFTQKHVRHCERSEAIQPLAQKLPLDCFGLRSRSDGRTGVSVKADRNSDRRKRSLPAMLIALALGIGAAAAAGTVILGCGSQGAAKAEELTWLD